MLMAWGYICFYHLLAFTLTPSLRHWLANADPAVDQQLFEIAVRGQEAVARRLTTGAQHRAMHAMAMSAGLQQGDASRLGARGLGALGTGSGQFKLHHDDDSVVNTSDSEPQAEATAGTNLSPEPEPLSVDVALAHDTSSLETLAGVEASRARNLSAQAATPPMGLMPHEVDLGRKNSEFGEDGLIDGVQAIAKASSILIRLGHPDLLFQVEELICTWVCVPTPVFSSHQVLISWRTGECFFIHLPQVKTVGSVTASVTVLTA
jgi:hypothetical protein